MKHILWAMKQEMKKMNKVISNRILDEYLKLNIYGNGVAYVL